MIIKGPIGVFRDLIEAAIDLVTDVKVEMLPDGLSLKAVDAANVAMVQLSIPATSFTEYEGNGEAIVIELGKFQEYLGAGKKDSTVTLYREDNKLVVEIDKKRFKLGLISPDAIKPFPKLPDMVFPCRVCVGGPEFVGSFQAAEKVNDHVVLDYDGSKLGISAVGDIDLFADEITGEGLVASEGESSISTYDTGYLDDLAKTLKKAAQIVIEFGSDYPMRISADIGGMAVSYLLAPRIQGD